MMAIGQIKGQPSPAEKAAAMMAQLGPNSGLGSEASTEDEPIRETRPAPATPPVVVFVPPHRMTIVDVNELGAWLVERLRIRFPKQTDAMLISWLKACTNDNECFFERAAGGVIMATVHRSFLAPPWIEEVFCFARTEEDKLHATGLYTDVRTWALGLGASHIIVEQFTDVERADISLEIGTPKREVRSIVYLPVQQPRMV